MKIFEVIVKKEDLNCVLATKYPNVLASYWFVKKLGADIAQLADDYCFFLDSGAYSASTCGAKINIDNYMRFIDDNKSLIDMYAGLDDILDYRISADNQRIMEESGFTPLPTFHWGEPITVLEQLLERYSHLCIGGVVGKSDRTKIDWIGNLYARLIAKKYRDTKIHMFGVGSERVLTTFPFYSADCSSGSLQSAIKMWHMTKGPTVKVGQLAKKARDTVEGVQAIRVERDDTLSPGDKGEARFKKWLITRKLTQQRITDLWLSRGIVWED